jgi:hypothetical protein
VIAGLQDTEQSDVAPMCARPPLLAGAADSAFGLGEKNALGVDHQASRK